ncbi:MAG TPA: DUF4307 domain-containing protein [Motilibacteraceae bacterium]|nr:DUF4307 domain-containing protein [Motilibacteraceae bacterium]
MASPDPRPLDEPAADDVPAAPLRRPADRYGDDRGRRPLALATLAVVVLVLLGVLGWIGYHVATPGVSASLVGYRIDGRDVHVQVEVVKGADATVTCRVRAQDRSATTIGTTEVTVGPPEHGRRSVVDVLVRTSGTPVNGDLVGCRRG